jgi:hypothetical protein
VDLNYRAGGFTNKKYAAIAAGKDSITIRYCITTHTLYVKARVHKVTQMEAVGESDAGSTSPMQKKRKV